MSYSSFINQFVSLTEIAKRRKSFCQDDNAQRRKGRTRKTLAEGEEEEYDVIILKMDLPSEYVRVRGRNERRVHNDCVHCTDGVSALEHDLETGAKKNKHVLLTLAFEGSLLDKYRRTTA